MIDVKIKNLFFDTAKVINALDEASRKALSRVGAFIRTTARQSIKKPGKKITAAARAFGREPVSGPGKPPFSHTGLLRNFIYFGYDPAKKTVIVGPEKLNQQNSNAPRVLEQGGQTDVWGWIGKGRRGKRRVTIAARPYMGPALRKNLDQIPNQFRDSIRV